MKLNWSPKEAIGAEPQLQAAGGPAGAGNTHKAVTGMPSEDRLAPPTLSSCTVIGSRMPLLYFDEAGSYCNAIPYVTACASTGDALAVNWGWPEYAAMMPWLTTLL